MSSRFSLSKNVEMPVELDIDAIQRLILLIEKYFPTWTVKLNFSDDMTAEIKDSADLNKDFILSKSIRSIEFISTSYNDGNIDSFILFINRFRSGLNYSITGSYEMVLVFNTKLFDILLSCKSNFISRIINSKFGDRIIAVFTFLVSLLIFLNYFYEFIIQNPGEKALTAIIYALIASFFVALLIIKMLNYLYPTVVFNIGLGARYFKFTKAARTFVFITLAGGIVISVIGNAVSKKLAYSRDDATFLFS